MFNCNGHAKNHGPLMWMIINVIQQKAKKVEKFSSLFYYFFTCGLFQNRRNGSHWRPSKQDDALRKKIISRKGAKDAKKREKIFTGLFQVEQNYSTPIAKTLTSIWNAENGFTLSRTHGKFYFSNPRCAVAFKRRIAVHRIIRVKTG